MSSRSPTAGRSPSSHAAILAHAREQGLEWVEDESNADEALMRNFVRRRLGPLIESRFPRWRDLSRFGLP